MKDMLVKLYELPEKCLELDKLKKDITFRRPLAAEKSILCDWVKKNLEMDGKVKWIYLFQNNQFQPLLLLKMIKLLVLQPMTQLILIFWAQWEY